VFGAMLADYRPGLDRVGKSPPPGRGAIRRAVNAVHYLCTLLGASVAYARFEASEVGMPENDFLYDIFLSYNNHDEEKVRKLYEKFKDAGLRPFFAPVNLSNLVGKDGWKEAILAAIPQSWDLAVYCTKDSALSSWVKEEVIVFRSSFPDSQRDDHRIFAIADPGMTQADLDNVLSNSDVLKDVLRPRDESHALRIMTESKIAQMTKALVSAEERLDQTKTLARQSFDYYRHTRFWKPFSDRSGQDLHIFTCGRDTAEDTTQRGSGGRTSIDKWDYQAAVDITHYFARHHRDIGVTIEQPVSKARIDAGTRSFDTSTFSEKLINRNCVIIGSPDVSDFAEIILARLLRINPYSPDTRLTTGVRIRKAGQRFSTFYEQSSDQEPDGIRVIRDGKSAAFHPSEGSRDHGVMILADNPFSQSSHKHKILILAGHSGVATRAMSLLLTNEEPWCLDAFYDLDQEIALMGSPLAVIIEVSYQRLPGHEGGIGDEREISDEPGSIRVLTALPLKA
jgi:TIR domain